MVDRATKLKASKVDANPTKGDTSNTSSLHLPDSLVQSSFSSIGLNLRTDDDSLTASILKMKRAEECRVLESHNSD